MPDLWKNGVTTLPFWAKGNYTIVPGRHIGLDQATVPGGQPWDIPALVAGTVVRSVQSPLLGHITVVDTGRSTRRYISYCHAYYGGAATVGTKLSQGQRTSRLALANEQPGSLWNGVHCHVVVHDKPGGAYQTGLNDNYYDPGVEILVYKATTAGGGGAKPFPTPDPVEKKEVEEMIAFKSPGRRPVAVDGNGYRLLTDEEWGNFWGTKYEGNDRQYDLNYSIRAGITPWVDPRQAFVGKGASADRPLTLFAPGYIKVLTEEEAANNPFTNRVVVGNDRQYDLWVNQAISGKGFSAVINPSGLTVTVDSTKIAKAVRAEFATDPLK